MSDKIKKNYRIYKSDAEKLERLFTNPSKAVRLLISHYIERNEAPINEQIGDLLEMRKRVHNIGIKINKIAQRANTGEQIFFQQELKPELIALRAILKDIRKSLGGFNGS